MLVTASKDTTFKMFLLNIEILNSSIKLNFDRSKWDIKNLGLIDANNVFGYSEHSSSINLWDLMNGQIIESIETNLELLGHVVYSDGLLCLLGLQKINEVLVIILKVFAKEQV
jgi:hypothetical protein